MLHTIQDSLIKTAGKGFFLRKLFRKGGHGAKDHKSFFSKYRSKQVSSPVKMAARGDFVKRFLPEFRSRQSGHAIFNSLSPERRGNDVANSVADDLRWKKNVLKNNSNINMKTFGK